MFLKHIRFISVLFTCICAASIGLLYTRSKQQRVFDSSTSMGYESNNVSKDLLYIQSNQHHVVDSSTSMGYESNNMSKEFKTTFSHSKVVFYNRIGKCGSRSILHIAWQLSNVLNYSYVESLDFQNDHPSTEERMKEMSRISMLESPAFYNRHIYFLDFKRFGHAEPIYINIIRDPIERFSSQYNFLKYGDLESQVLDPEINKPDINDCVSDEVYLCRTNFMFYIGLYFCGFDPICENPSAARVRLAKKHIDENYAFIGMMEEFDVTIALLQILLPEYFSGATNYYIESDTRKKTVTNRKEVLTQKSAEKLRNVLMKDEYEVYEHAKRKYFALKEKYGFDT